MERIEYAIRSLVLRRVTIAARDHYASAGTQPVRSSARSVVRVAGRRQVLQSAYSARRSSRSRDGVRSGVSPSYPRSQRSPPLRVVLLRSIERRGDSTASSHALEWNPGSWRGAFAPISSDSPTRDVGTKSAESNPSSNSTMQWIYDHCGGTSTRSH
jgi:hypothetical protein